MAPAFPHCFSIEIAQRHSFDMIFGNRMGESTMVGLKFSRVTAIALIASIAIAEAGYGADARLKENPFWESIQPDVDVSGFVVAGLTTDSVLSGRDLSEVQIRPPGSMAGAEVCLTVQSRDGVYLSRNTYVLPPSIDGEPVNLSYNESNAHDLLKNYGDGHLAISVTAGNCQSPGSTYLQPHSAGTPERIAVDLMINGFGATDVFYSVPALDKTGDCEALDDGRTTVFDFRCRIELSEALRKPLQIRVDRERYGRALPPATVSLAADAF